MTVTAERSVIDPNIRRWRESLRYGRSNCHYDLYDQNAVKKFNENSKIPNMSVFYCKRSDIRLLNQGLLPTRINAIITRI